MKKIMVKEYRYRCPLYPVYYSIVFTNDLRRYVREEHGHDLGTGTGACTIHGDTGPIVVVLPKEFPPEYLYHEVAHLAQCILGRVGIKFAYDNQEPFAYVLGKVMANAVRADKNRRKDKWTEYKGRKEKL